LHRRYGHIQEVIVQNFRAKPTIPMRRHREPTLADLQHTLAIARLILYDMNIQAPPNLSGDDYPFLLKAGLNDLGGISPLTKDYINPERPWPQLETLAANVQKAGYQLRERLSVYPEFLCQDEFMDPRVAGAARALADERGFATSHRSRQSSHESLCAV
jgi:FO synthase